MRAATILVTGAGGLLTPFLCDEAAARGKVVTLSRTSGDRRVDLADRAAVERVLAETDPGLVLNAAAMTDVDACERDPVAADRNNRLTVQNLAEALPADQRLVQISTDQVYPDRPGPHREGSEDPVNVYGSSKLAGERAVLLHPGALVVRTNMFGPSRTPGRRSLSDFVIDGLASGRALTLFEDVLFSPLHLATLARLVFRLLEVDATGVVNLGSREGASKAAFALAIARHRALPTASATLGRSTALPDRAPRSRDLRLDVGRAEAMLGFTMPTLAQEIAKL